MTAALILLLLLQAPTLEKSGSESLSGEAPRALSVSADGKYLVLGFDGHLEIRDPKTLKTIHKLDLRWTAFGFDERDSELLVVGDDAVRFRTKDWQEFTRAVVPDAGFRETKSNRSRIPEAPQQLPLLPKQALATPDLDFFYRTKAGGIAQASWKGRKLEVAPVALESDGGDGVARIFELRPDGALVVTQRDEGAYDRPSVGQKGQLQSMNGVRDVVGVASLGSKTVYVGSGGETLFETADWKMLAERRDQSNRGVAGALWQGWLFIGGERGLRAWSLDRFAAENVYKEPAGAVDLVDIDARNSTLYTIGGSTLRRWSVKE